MIHPALDGTVAAHMVTVNMPNGLCILAYARRCIFFGIRRCKELILEKAVAHESDLAGMLFGEHQLAKVQAYPNACYGFRHHPAGFPLLNAACFVTCVGVMRFLIR